jgi:foldase protein PrsA
VLSNRLTRRRLAAAAGLAGAALVLSACGDGAPRAASAASVGGESIATDDLRAIVDRGLADPQAAQQFGADRQTYQRQVLARLINRQVLAEAAAREGVEVAQGDVDTQLADFAEQAGGREALEAQAAQSGISAIDLPDFIRDIVVERKLGDALTEDVELPDEQLEALYQENIAEYDQVRSRHILVADEAQARDILAQVQADPEAFAELAAQFSTDTSSKDNGGDLGFAGRGAFVPEFEQVLFNAAPGSYEVVNTEFGWHVINPIERQTTPLAEAEEELRRTALQEERATRSQELLRTTAADLDITVNPRFGTWNSETGTVEPEESPNGVSSPEPSGGTAPGDGQMAPGGDQPAPGGDPNQPAPNQPPPTPAG